MNVKIFLKINFKTLQNYAPLALLTFDQTLEHNWNFSRTRRQPSVDAALWEHSDKIVTQLFAAQTPGWHFLDSRVITLSLSSTDASSS